MGQRERRKKIPLNHPRNPSLSATIAAVLLLLSPLPEAQSVEIGGIELDSLGTELSSGDGRFWEELEAVIAGTSSFSIAREILTYYYESPEAEPYRRRLGRWLVHLFELSADFEGARRFLIEMNQEMLLEGREPLVVDLARIEIEMGYYDSARRRLLALEGRRLAASALAEARVMQCRIALLSDDHEMFENCVSTLAQDGWEDMALALSLQRAEVDGDRDAYEAASSSLAERYPLVWHALSTDHERIFRYPSPTLVLNAPDSRGAPYTEGASDGPDDGSPEESAVAASSSGDAEEGTSDGQLPSGVQVGSFRDVENAQYMARDVRNLGFEVAIRSRSRGGSHYHQVIVDPGGDTAQQTVVKLKEHGLEGFLVFD